jgi:hypothetical protein
MPDKGFRDHYAPAGPEGYYRAHADDYANPHEPAVAAALAHAVAAWPIDFSRTLDVAAGGGEATLALLRLLPDIHVEGIDPFTHRLYEKRTGRWCAAASFEDIAQGAHVLSAYSCIVCSCALHLVEDSWLPAVCLALALAAPELLVLTPLTRPELRTEWGWQLQDATSCTAEGRSLRLRWYRRTLPVSAAPVR